MYNNFMTELTGAQILIESLIREGVEIIFGIPGGANLPIFNHLYDSPIRFVLTRHEQGAAHMADGYARSTGKIGVCIATSGPGATNLTTGLATAYMDSVPIIAITGQVATHLIGNDAFQEADATGITRQATKHNFLITNVDDLARVVREAFYIAKTGRPGPVHIDIPVDVQRAKTNFIWPQKVQIRSFNPVYDPHPLQIRKAVDLIINSKKPLLYVGGGAIISNSTDQLIQLSELADIPVTLTLMANGAFPYTHKNYLGVLGMHGRYAANMAMQRCDVLITCGARFDDRVTGRLKDFSPNSKKIHIDIDPTSISKNVKADIPIVADLKKALTEIIKNIKSPIKHTDWIKELKEIDEKNPFQYKDDEKLHPQFIIKKIHEITNAEAIITTGVGQNQMWAMQFYPAKYPRTFLSSGGLGTMGYGFPSAIGAKFGNPQKEVICIDGDGSFQMTHWDLATIKYEDIKIIVCIINNSYLGMVRQWQDLFYEKKFSGTFLKAKGGMSSLEIEKKLSNQKYYPDFVLLAESYGHKAVRVTKKEEVEPVLKEALKSKETTIIEFVVPPEDKVFPMMPPGGSLDEIITDMA